MSAVEIKEELEETEGGYIEAIEMIKIESIPTKDLSNEEIDNAVIRTTTQENMADEQKDHVPIDNSRQCGVCKVIFNTTSDMKDHTIVLGTEGKYLNICCVCKKTFRRGTSGLKDHQRTHTGEKPYKCEICEKTFSAQGNMLKHKVLMHTNKRAFECDICSKRFKQLTHLQAHKESHSDLRPYQCDICNTRFKTEQILKIHQRRHDKPRKNARRCITCPVCSKIFSTYFQLKMHMRNHESSFLCSECNIVFDSFKQQAEHMEQVHSKSMLNDCPECKELFADSKELQAHVREVHNKLGKWQYEHKCTLCPKVFSRSTNMKRHLKQHTGIELFKCEYCSKGLKSSDSYKRHLRIHTNYRPYVCDICNRGYTAISTLKEHKVISHSGKNPYGCMICKKFHPILKRTKDHVRKHHEDALQTCSIDDLVVIDYDNTDSYKEVQISVPIKTELEEDSLGDAPERVEVKEEIFIKEEPVSCL